jgi:hypothetical protein
MSKNPDAATAFFDPAGNGAGADHVGNDHLHYLVGSGDGTRVWPKHLITGAAVTEMDDPLSRTGLGAALEAASTGHPPFAEGQDPWPEAHHSPGQARVMGGIINQLSPASGTDASVPANLRQPIAAALSEYASDTHQTLAGVDVEYIKASDGKGYFVDGHGAHLAADPKGLVQVMRGLSEDPDAYATLQKSEDRHINYELDKLPPGGINHDLDRKFENLGAVRGVYSAIQEDVINDARMDKYAQADWKAKVAYHVIGGALTPLYFTTGGVSIAYGDSLQRGVDTVTWEMDNAWKAQADAEANAKVADTFLSANKHMPLLINGWADGRSDIDMSNQHSRDRVQNLTTAALQGLDRGAGTAEKYLTDTSN